MSKSVVVAAWFGAAFIGLGLGCSSPSSKCTAGASTPCTCNDGRAGAQTCAADGTLGTCTCGGAGGGSGGGSAGGTAGGSSGGTAGGSGGGAAGGSGGGAAGGSGGGAAFSCGTSNVAFSYAGSNVIYGTVVSHSLCWMDRDLGASRAATSVSDTLAYGDLFQWGRGADGHQLRTSATTTTISNSDSPGHGNFIISLSDPNHDWRNPQNNSLWQGVSGINNPCPSGWRVPTVTELDTERTSWSSNNPAGAFASPLKFVAGGYRNYGPIINQGTTSQVWTSTTAASGGARYLDITATANMGTQDRGLGFAVRCVQSDPCLSNNGGCSADASCTNNGGVAACACRTGYSGNGITCADINECLTNNGGCSTNATCTNTPGSRTCGCNSGYSGDGFTCADINECLTNNGGCDTNATCANTPGSRNCTCNSGYTGDGITCALTVACGTSAATFSYNGSTVTYGTIVRNGLCWMDRDLGATRAATASNDTQAYGDLFQWGRLADGHQLRSSSTVTTISSTDNPGHSNFINSLSDSNHDWRNPQNNNLWQGTSGINNPCPSGWRLPTVTELDTERMSWSSNNTSGAFASSLKFAAGGYRNYGPIINQGSTSQVWTSTTATSGGARYLDITSAANMGTQDRGLGFAVRCVQPLGPTNPAGLAKICLDGTSGKGRSVAMNAVATLTSATMEIWFKSSDPAAPPTAERQLMFFHPNAYVSGNFPAVGVSLADATAQNMAPLTGRIMFVVVDARGGPQNALNARGFDIDASLPSFDEKQWHHYAVVFSGTTQRAFVDGIELTSVLQRDGAQTTSFASAFGSGFVATYGSPYLTLGSFARDSIRFAQGGISDARVSNNARYSGAFTPTFRPAADANTVLLLPISENTGLTSSDQSGNAFNITWSGGFSWCSL